MKVPEFKEFLEKEILSSSYDFIINMQRLEPDSDHSFLEWLDMFIHWMEWGSQEDFDFYYG